MDCKTVKAVPLRPLKKRLRRPAKSSAIRPKSIAAGLASGRRRQVSRAGLPSVNSCCSCLLLGEHRWRGVLPDFGALRAMLFYFDEFPGSTGSTAIKHAAST